MSRLKQPRTTTPAEPVSADAVRSWLLPPDTSLDARSLPNDIRKAGWSVAVHNDYRIGEKSYTFWLFTKGERCVKGEGGTDAEALDVVRSKLKRQP
jgi:hypothetical protein